MHAQATAFDPEPVPRAQLCPTRILVLEADPDIRSWLIAELGLAGYDVLHAATASDAFVAWVISDEPVDLLMMNPLTLQQRFHDHVKVVSLDRLDPLALSATFSFRTTHRRVPWSH